MATAMDHHPTLPDADPNAHIGRKINENAEDLIEEEEQEEEYLEASESSSEEEIIDETVREDMLRLEESFAEHGMKFRLIDRIGEGEPAPTIRLPGPFS